MAACRHGCNLFSDGPRFCFKRERYFMNTSAVTKQWLVLPLNLVWGYIAIALFMTGDGF